MSNARNLQQYFQKKNLYLQKFKRPICRKLLKVLVENKVVIIYGGKTKLSKPVENAFNMHRRK